MILPILVPAYFQRKQKYFEIVDLLKTKFKNVNFRPETKGAWVTNIYCFNE